MRERQTICALLRRIVLIAVFLYWPLTAMGNVYYLSADGNDSGPGTMERPFKTLDKAIALVQPGETIHVRGGTYECEKTIVIRGSGEPGSPIRVWAYGDEVPQFNVRQGKGLILRGAYWHLKGLVLSHGETTGLQLEGEGAHHNVLERLQIHDNGNTGINLTRGAARNLVLNCDAYRNFDPPTNGENADGFGAKFDMGPGNVFIGCRAWNNADDGYDCWYAGNAVRIEHCFAYRNGLNLWNHPGFTGNANGFKLGQMEGSHVLIRCIAWEHPMRGFDLNGNSTGVTLYNCTALRNKIDYAFTFTKGNIERNVLRNNLSLGGEVRLDSNVDDQANSWDLPDRFRITEQDFSSLDDRVAAGSRNPDGGIPDSNFLRPAPQGRAIDRGTDVNLPFKGRAPDLGAFEWDPNRATQDPVQGLHQAVRDGETAKVNDLLAAGNNVNTTDWLGYTSLHWACYFGYTNLVELLLSKGADPNLVSGTGRTALDVATAMGYENIADLLRKYRAKK